MDLKNYTIAERYHDKSMPNGWYAACQTNELPPNHIKTLSILNKEFILYRTKEGKPVMLDAYCPHQGTHLGYGGKIVNDCIVCPFHRWHFNAKGKCVDIPYTKKIPPLERNALNDYPTVENESIIFFYYHKNNKAPEYFLPDFEQEFPADTWTKPKFINFSIKTHIQEFGENGFDTAHFTPVHRSEKSKIIVKSPVTDKLLKYELHLTYPGYGMGLPIAKVNINSDWIYYGLSVFSAINTVEKFSTIIRQNFYFTPQNNDEVKVRVALRVNKKSLPGIAVFKWLQIKFIHFQNKRILLRNFNEDRPIWENKIFRSKPVLCDGDGPILHYRNWAEQYYSN